MENLNKLPFLNISKENFELMDDLLEKEQIGNVISAIYEDGCGKTHFFRCGMKAALTKYFDFSNIFSIFVQKVSLVTI